MLRTYVLILTDSRASRMPGFMQDEFELRVGSFMQSLSLSYAELFQTGIGELGESVGLCSHLH